MEKYICILLLKNYFYSFSLSFNLAVRTKQKQSSILYYSFARKESCKSFSINKANFFLYVILWKIVLCFIIRNPFYLLLLQYEPEIQWKKKQNYTHICSVKYILCL